MKRMLVCLVGGVVAMVLVAGCGSESGGESSTSVASVSSSVDLSSTKDLSGVTATVGGSANPYFSHLPDLCPRFPDSALQKLGFTVEPGYKQPFHPQETSALLQSCGIGFDSPGGEGDVFTFSPGMTTEPFAKIIGQEKVRVVEPNIPLGKNRATLFTRKGESRLCDLAWGTFYGTALWIIQKGYLTGGDIDSCAKLKELGESLFQYMPSSPSEMGR